MVRRLLRHVFRSKTHVRAFAFTAFIALIWLNQSTGGAEYEALRERTFAPRSSGSSRTAESVVDLLRSPFMFLYRRSRDEALYFATASATFGQPYDSGVLAERGDSPLPPVTTPVDGRFHVPYAEVPFEYPPPNVVAVLLPRIVASRFSTYSRVFGALMGLMLLAAAMIGARLGSLADPDPDSEASLRDEAKRIGVFGLLLLAHGAIAIQRLDAIVALLAILMVRAAVLGQARSLGFFGGLIGAAKLVPILVLPVLVLASGMRTKRPIADVFVGACAGLAIGLGPMLLLGRESLPLLFTYHSARGLHVESSLGVVYGALKVLIGAREAATLDYGSYNFHGAVSQWLAKAGVAVTVGLVGVVGYAARAKSDDGPLAERTERIVLAALAGVAALWLGGKVFSPQYLTWALPLVIALPGRTWRGASLGLGVILLLSQIYLRGYYDHVHDQLPAGVITMVARLGILVALFVIGVRRLKRLPIADGAQVR